MVLDLNTARNTTPNHVYYETIPPVTHSVFDIML